MRRAQVFWFGFYGAIGVALAAVLLLGAWRVLGAALSIITPFIIAIVVALMLDPVVDRVQKRSRRGGRLPAVITVYLLFLCSFFLILAFLVPSLIAQVGKLVAAFPGYLDTSRTFVNQWLQSHQRLGPFQLPPNLNTLIGQYSDQVSAAMKASLGRVASILIGSVAQLIWLIIVPIVAFYLLMDIDRLRARLLFLLPQYYRTSVERTALDVGTVFGSYIRGLLIVSALYGVVSVFMFLALGLRSYALLLGFLAGVLYMVPYVGPLITALLATMLSLATGHGAGHALLVLALLLVLNQIFDNVVTPRIVGGGVGLHPVVTVFALFLGAELFGIWGMLLSVPVAASIQLALFRLFPRLNAPTPLAFLMPNEQNSASADPPGPETA